MKKSESRSASNTTVGVSIIGAGRLGTALARALSTVRDYRVEAVVTRKSRPANLPAGTSKLTLRQLDKLPSSELLLITTPDDQINAAAQTLAQIFQHRPLEKARVALHASGALSSAMLDSLRAANCAIGSLHPLVAVSDGAAGAHALFGARYCIEGDAAARRAARRLVRALNGESLTIKTEQKALYHAAAVMSAGHLVALLDAAIEMLMACGLSERRARRLLLSLAASALHNLHGQPAAQALTGPFVRADYDVVRRHLAALHLFGDRNASDIYLALGQRELQLAARRRVAQSKLNMIARELDEASQRFSKT